MTMGKDLMTGTTTIPNRGIVRYRMRELSDTGEGKRQLLRRKEDSYQKGKDCIIQNDLGKEE